MTVQIDLTGKRALIMGVRSNEKSIASGITRALAQAGAELFFSWHREKSRQELANLILILPTKCQIIGRCDISLFGDIQNLFSMIKQRVGELDILVHSISAAPAGLFTASGVKRLSGIEEKDFLGAFQMGVTSFLTIVQEFSKLTKEKASILTISYGGSQKVDPVFGPLGPVKAALESTVRCLAKELGERGIRINAILAPVVETPSSAAFGGKENVKKIIASQRDKAPLGLEITPEVIGEAALFLLSDLASGITGHIFPVDGGFNIMGP